MTIKAIYFDLGGVIVRTEHKAPRTQLGAEFGMSRLELEKIVHDWKNESSAARASIGAITEEAHWINVTRALNLPLDERRRIQDQFFAGDRIDWDLVNFLREARKTYKIGLISNAWDGLRPWIRTQKFDDAFDHLTISAEIHAVKPRPDIYHYALHALGVKAEESVFVDDFIENIHAANALGMKAVHFLSAEQALADVKNLLEF